MQSWHETNRLQYGRFLIWQKNPRDLGDNSTPQLFSKFTFLTITYLDLLSSTALTLVIPSIEIKQNQKPETNQITMNCLVSSFSADLGYWNIELNRVVYSKSIIIYFNLLRDSFIMTLINTINLSSVCKSAHIITCTCAVITVLLKDIPGASEHFFSRTISLHEHYTTLKGPFTCINRCVCPRF